MGNFVITQWTIGGTFVNPAPQIYLLRDDKHLRAPAVEFLTPILIPLTKDRSFFWLVIKVIFCEKNSMT